MQGMVKRVFYTDGETKPAVSDFDLIIVDEAHRGYLLDKDGPDGVKSFFSNLFSGKKSE